MSWPLFFICKLKTKLFLHMQCPILFGVDFGKQQISSNDIRSSYFCVPLWEFYTMNIFRLFLQRKGKKVMFFSVQTDTVWLKLSSVSKVAAHSIGAQLVGHFTSSSHLNLKKITFVGSLDCPIGVLNHYVVLRTGPSWPFSSLWESEIYKSFALHMFAWIHKKSVWGQCIFLWSSSIFIIHPSVSFSGAFLHKDCLMCKTKPLPFLFQTLSVSFHWLLAFYFLSF